MPKLRPGCMDLPKRLADPKAAMAVFHCYVCSENEDARSYVSTP